ncbi:MAG: YdjY domain-containing protein [Tepidisphaerales bacterium]
MPVTNANPIRRRLLALCLLIPAVAAFAQFGPDNPDSGKPDDKEAASLAEKAYKDNLAKYKDNADFFVRPGLVADRKAKTVRLWGRSTHLATSEPAEFFVIPGDSGKDYEAVAAAYVKASDVRAALEFVGMKPGRPTNFGDNLFWPKGERVIAFFEWQQPPEKPDGKPEPKRVRAEDILFDIKTGRPLPHAGFVFTGSTFLKREDEGKEIFAADALDARSVIADYNERSSILDVPRQAPQGAVYGTIKLNPAYRFGPEKPLQITLEPEYKDGKLRVRDLALDISIPPGTTVQDGKFILKDAQGNPIAPQPTFINALAEFGKLTDAGVDPYVTLSLDGEMTLAAARNLALFLGTIDSEKGIRIEGPRPGQLYYRNFTPREDWRDRNKRLGRPWELQVSQKDGHISGTLILPADQIDNNQGLGDLKFPVGSPEELAKVLQEKSDKWAHSVYIFAPPEMTVGPLLDFIRPGMKVRPAMYVFLPEPQ